MGMSYSAALDYARRHGGGTVTPTRTLPGQSVQYKVELTGGGGGGGTRSPSTGGVDPATMKALKEAEAYYGREGGYGRGVEAGIERGRVKAVSSGMQGLVSAGLAGTTMAGGLGKKYEEEVAMPARERVEETRAERLSGLHVLKAQIIQGATESARSRALQKYLAQLQSGTSMQIAGMRSPSMVAPARVPVSSGRATDGGYSGRMGADFSGGGGMSPIAAGGYGSMIDIPMATGTDRPYYGAAWGKEKPGGETMEDMMERWRIAGVGG